jgi:putative oxidoreductase
MKKLYYKLVDKLDSLKDIPLLLIRLTIAYGFYNPAMAKIKGFDNTVMWFESMDMPLPTLNAYLATITESLGVVLLVLGLGVRIISIPLMITMLVAIIMVHWDNGFSGKNGFEIPFLYLIMLFTLFIKGGGRLGLDNLFKQKG